MKKCYVFPGQGGQFVGMGRELHDGSAAARAVFDAVDGALGERLSDVIFNGPDDILNQPENVQPAIFAVSMAMWAASRESEVGSRKSKDIGHWTSDI
jgi:[acyl-carrier-protein] S-malonyltransferase